MLLFQHRDACRGPESNARERKDDRRSGKGNRGVVELANRGERSEWIHSDMQDSGGTADVAAGIQQAHDLGINAELSSWIDTQSAARMAADWAGWLASVKESVR
jgi:hypothetical protein